MTKELLFSVTAKDCEFQATRGTGKGGQAKNKNSTAIYCTHLASGAKGYAEDSRKQIDNKRLAFKRMADSKRFKEWHKVETMKYLGLHKEIDQVVESQMKQIKVEGVVDGNWQEL